MINIFFSLLFFYFFGVVGAILFVRFYNAYVKYRKLPKWRLMPGLALFLSWLAISLVFLSFIIDAIEGLEGTIFEDLLNKLVGSK
jgi:TRAP-type C4-dicarboxylate transport system permease small subunit